MYCNKTNIILEKNTLTFDYIIILMHYIDSFTYYT